MNTLLQPFVMFWALLILAAILYKFKFLKLTKLFVVLSFAQLFLFGVTPISIWLTRNLEQKYPVFENMEGNEHDIPIVVLGGGHINDSTLTSVQKLHLSVLNRLATGIRLYNSERQNILVSTGYSSSDQTPNATVIANAAISLGVNPRDTVTLITTANTWEEAVTFKKRFPESEKLFLVTSALHMPRAMETFEYQNLKPIAVPTDFLVKKEPEKPIYSWFPSWKKLAMTQRALHEYLGIWYYRWFKQN